VNEFLLLGPFEASVAIPGGKPKALLARLLLDTGRVISADTLVESLWDDPPSSARKLLQAHVSALRKALGPEAIVTRGAGYVLGAATSDLSRFEELTERAAAERDAQQRAATLREALDLWRGEPLAEFRAEPFARSAADRLGELRLHALVHRMDAELELGLHERLASELQALVDEEPLREQLRARLMLALYRGGRQADALEVYRKGRRLMVDRLGLEPGPALQELERAILRQDTGLETAPSDERRGPVVCVGCAPLSLVGPLGREVVIVELTDLAGLPAAARRVDVLRSPDVRTTSFTSGDASADAIRLAGEQEADLLVVAEATPALLSGAPCDVALLHEPAAFEPDGPILAPFGGSRDEWPALELAAWLARAHTLPLRLLGVEATEGRRDASRMLAAASLALQRFAGVAAEPAIVAAGPGGVLSQEGSAVVASLPRELDPTRRALLDLSTVPVLLVHGGLRPSGLAPERSLTRFSWTAAPDSNRI
jgi:DNA-binding SARP family transcriptional activator